MEKGKEDWKEEERVGRASWDPFLSLGQNTEGGARPGLVAPGHKTGRAGGQVAWPRAGT